MPRSKLQAEKLGELVNRGVGNPVRSSRPDEPRELLSAVPKSVLPKGTRRRAPAGEERSIRIRAEIEEALESRSHGVRVRVPSDRRRLVPEGVARKEDTAGPLLILGEEDGVVEREPLPDLAPD